MASTLRIFVTDDCPGCAEARHIALQVRQEFPHLKVEIVDLTDPRTTVPEEVFATPTYMLDDRVVSLGNPGPAEITRWAASANSGSV